MDAAVLASAKTYANTQLVSKMDAINANHFFADDTARDAYFVANSTELVTGVLVSSNDVYQMYNGSAWITKTPVSGVSKADFDATNSQLAAFYVVLENEIQNGNFVNTTGWLASASTIVAADNTVTVKGSGTNTMTGVVQKTSLPCSAGKRYYYKFVGKVTNSDATAIGVEYVGSTGGTYALGQARVLAPVQNQAYTIEEIITLTNQTGTLNFKAMQMYDDAETALNKEMIVQYIIIIDCDKFETVTGLDATLANIHLYLDTFENEWFDGEQHITKATPSLIVPDDHRRDYILDNGVVIEDFNDFDDWTNNTPENGSISSDITFSKSGGSGLRFNVTSIGGYVQAGKDIFLDLSSTNHRLSMWIYLHNEPTDYAKISIELYNVYSNKMFICNRVATRYHKGWNMMTISDNEWATGAGTPKWTLMFTKMQIKVTAATGKTCALTVSDMRMGMEFSPKIILRFDDAMTGVLENAVPLLEANGLRGTIYANKDFATSGNPNYCTVANLQTMYAAGHDIGNHGASHTGLAEMTYAETLVEVGSNQDWLIENGFYKSARHFCVPNSQNTEFLQIALDVLGVLTSTTGGGTTYMPNMDLYNIPCRSVLNTTTVEQVEDMIDDAVLNGKTLVLMFHNVVDVPAGESGIDIAYEYATTNFQAVCEYLGNNDLAKYVVTMSEYYIGLNR